MRICHEKSLCVLMLASILVEEVQLTINSVGTCWRNRRMHEEPPYNGNANINKSKAKGKAGADLLCSGHL